MSHITRTLADGVVTLTFDRAGSSANLFDTATLRELDTHLAAIEAIPALRGVVLLSAKHSVFIAGADLKEVSSFAEAGMTDFIVLGQEVFSRLARMKAPTVAAIHGACVGGGYEVALACRYRVASDHRSTKIGLPETRLGIIPAWGGSTRLPRLIGVGKALDIILGGKTPDARKAKKLGMVDEVVPREHLHEAALRHIAGAQPAHAAGGVRVALESLIAPRIAGRKMRAATRGHYPALEAALRVVSKARCSSTGDSLRREREAIASLAPGPECRNLMRLFFLTEKAKKSPAGDSGPGIASVAVIGAGVMGSGIAQWCASKGLHVLLRDIDAGKVAAGMARIRKLVAGNRSFSPVEARDIIDRVTPSATPVPLSPYPLVIEAAVERMDLKKRVFADLETYAGADTLLATNTSALSITEIGAALKHPARLVGIHFFNPVHRMALVEVVAGKDTSPEAIAAAAAFVRKIGKLPVIVKDSPGFVVNRILMPYLIEAARFFDQGADPREIDEAMLDFGMPMGPLRLIDEVGLDVAEDVAATLAGAFGERLSPPASLAGMLKAGLTGRKVGKGFYVYSGKGEPSPNAAALKFRSGNADAGLTREDMRKRMASLMVNEAARCLEEGVAGSADDIDFAMVMGTGFAPFKGGPLRYADARGLRTLAEEMRIRGGRYAPCALLARLADKGGRFHAS